MEILFATLGGGPVPSRRLAHDEEGELEEVDIEGLDAPVGAEEPGAEQAADEPPLPPVAVEDDPLAVLRVNDAHRRADVGDADLWTADQVAAGFPRQYPYPAPTFAPRHWPTPLPVDQKKYSETFAAEFPFVQRLLPIENVVVAGGAAAWPFCETAKKPSDIDLFIHGIDPGDRAALWGKVAEIADKIHVLASAPGADTEDGEDDPARPEVLTEVLAPGVVTFTIYYGLYQFSFRFSPRPPLKAVKIQVILRAYPSVGSIIHAFDIPSCCVAYDGKKTRLTTLGAYAQMFRVNVVHPAYRSLTYETRLLKYFERGYALALPHVRPGLLNKAAAAKEAVALPHLVLKPIISRGYYNVGTLSLPPDASPPDSDYDTGTEYPHTKSGRVVDAVQYGAPFINLQQLASGQHRFVVMRVLEDFRARRRWRRRQSEEEQGIPFETYAETEPKLGDMCSRAALDKIIKRGLRGAIDARGRVHARILRTLFQLSDDEIARFTKAAVEYTVRYPGRRLDASAALERHKAALVEKYEAQSEATVDWWIVQDPGRQYTASRNPCIEDAALWYGGAHEPSPSPPGHDALVDTLLATLETRQLPVGDSRPVFDGSCPLCRDPLERGAANSIILACGHIFHWSETPEGCSGLYSWIQQDHSDCPTCRDQFGQGSSEWGDGESNDRVPVAVAW